MTPALCFAFVAVQIVTAVLALRWLSRIPTPTPLHKRMRTLAQVMMGLMIVGAIAVGIGEVMVLNMPIQQILQTV